jgi:hypothetical protein
MRKNPITKHNPIKRLVIAAVSLALAAGGLLASAAPAQAADVKVIANSSTTWKYFVGTSDPAPGADKQAWAKPGYSTSSWSSGLGGFGYGGGIIGTAAAPLSTTLPHYKSGSSGAVIPSYFFRTDFTLTAGEVATAKGVSLNISFDDVIVVYLNGHRVYGFNDWYGISNTSYMGSGSGNNGQTNPYTQTVTFPAEYLTTGTNSFAVELHNCRSNSSDVYLNVWTATLTDSYTPSAYPSQALSYVYPSDALPASTTGNYLTDMLTEFNNLSTTVKGVNAPSGCNTKAGVGCKVVDPTIPLAQLSWNDRVHVTINNEHMSGDPALSAQVDRAEYDADHDPKYTMNDALGNLIAGIYDDAITAGLLPKTTALASDVNAYIGGTGAPKSYYGFGRPFIRMGFTPATCGSAASQFPAGTCTSGRIMKSVNSLYPSTSIWMSSFPSGHTYNGYVYGVLMATLLPELGPQYLARAAEYGNNRIVIGFHYPLDVMGGRMIGTRVLQQRWADERYRNLLLEASAELHAVLLDGCNAWGYSDIETCNLVGNTSPYLTTDAAVQYYTEKMTYGFPRVHSGNYPVIVPDGAEDLLLTAFPELTDAQRRQILVQTAIPSGYALDKSYLGAAGDSYQRLNLAAAMAAQVTVDGGGNVTVSVPTTPASKAALQTATNNAGATASLNPSQYTPSSLATLNAAITQAQSVVDMASPTQAQLDAAASALEAAMTGLTLRADTSKLNALITSSASLKSSSYTSASWTAYTTALNAAKALLGNPEVSQVQVNQALTKLQNAKAALKALYKVTVVGGSGSGSYPAGTKVAIKAKVPAGKQFANWVAGGTKGKFANAKAANTTYTVGAGASTVTAKFWPKVTKVRTPLTTVYLQYKKSFTIPYATDGAVDKLTGWKSSNTAVATVNASGKVTAKSKAGTVKITAKTQNGKTLTVSVKVVKKVSKLKKLTVTAASSLTVGTSYQLKLKLSPAKATNATPVTFTSSNTAIATVDKAGKITAKKKGKVTITIKAGGKKVTKRVTVK